MGLWVTQNWFKMLFTILLWEQGEVIREGGRARIFCWCELNRHTKKIKRTRQLNLHPRMSTLSLLCTCKKKKKKSPDSFPKMNSLLPSAIQILFGHPVRFSVELNLNSFSKLKLLKSYLPQLRF